MPMKCIKSTKETPNIKLGTILRVKDKEADEKVDRGGWMYIPKSKWKLETRKPKQVEVSTEEKTKSSKKSK